jgi:hypothetical protein
VTHRLVIRDEAPQKLVDGASRNVYFGVGKVNPLIDKGSLFGVSTQKP